jgi:Spy/CpxP family protein refolding chaperone
MKLLQNPKFTGAALILLLVLNTSLLVFILCRHHGPPPPPGDHGGPRDFLVHELQFDKQQQDAYDALITEHRSAVDRLQEDIRANREAMVDELENSAADSSVVIAAQKKIGDDQQQLEKVTFDHFRKVRAICRPQQQVKFDEVIKEALHMMGPPPPRGGQ